MTEDKEEQMGHRIGVVTSLLTEMKASGEAIDLDTIEQCVLRFPTIDLQQRALEQADNLLRGTAWSQRSGIVEKKMYAKQKEQQDRQEQKQDKILDSMEKAANKKTNEFKVYPQAGSTANVGCQMQSPEFKVIPPSKEQQTALESRSATKGDTCQSKNKEGDEKF